MKNIKVMLITNIISPYRVPLFNSIAKKGIFNFKVVALAEKEENRKWEILKDKIKFDYRVLPGWHSFMWGKRRELSIHINKGVIGILRKYNPDIVITSGYDSLAYWQAFLFCKLHRKKFILWNGTTLLSAGSLRGFKGLVKRIIVRGADRYIAYGTKAKEYLEYFGAKAVNIYISTNTVDMEYFQCKVAEYRNKESFIKERKKYPKYLLLYVGQLIKRKGIIQVLRALDSLSDTEVGLIIAGSGPEENVLKVFCKEKNIKNIFFEGFKQQNELVKYYALADILVLPSFEEVWGLVVNEALASGLYTLSSKYAGVSYDLIKEGWNGEIFDPYNINEISRLIMGLKENIEDIRRKRDIISQHACSKFNIEKSTKTFFRMIEEIYNT